MHAHARQALRRRLAALPCALPPPPPQRQVDNSSTQDISHINVSLVQRVLLIRDGAFGDAHYVSAPPTGAVHHAVPSPGPATPGPGWPACACATSAPLHAPRALVPLQFRARPACMPLPCAQLDEVELACVHMPGCGPHGSTSGTTTLPLARNAENTAMGKLIRSTYLVRVFGDTTGFLTADLSANCEVRSRCA